MRRPTPSVTHQSSSPIDHYLSLPVFAQTLIAMICILVVGGCSTNASDVEASKSRAHAATDESQDKTGATILQPVDDTEDVWTRRPFVHIHIADVDRAGLQQALHQPVHYPGRPGTFLTYAIDGADDGTIETPEQYAVLMRSGWEPRHNVDRAMAYHPHKEAGLLYFLMNATPGTPGHKGLDLSDLANIPAQWGPWFEGPGPGDDEHLAGRFAEELAGFAMTTQQADNLVMNDWNGIDLRLEHLATGDWNGDGTEDHLVWAYTGYSRGRSWGVRYVVFSGIPSQPRKIVVSSSDPQFWQRREDKD